MAPRWQRGLGRESLAKCRQPTIGLRVDYSTLDDETLIGLIAHARAEALSELYDRYGRLVYSLAVNTVGDFATAEEITAWWQAFSKQYARGDQILP